MLNNFSDIPLLFYSSETSTPIRHCLVCERDLLEGAEYMIEKAFVNYPSVGTKDLVWEFAVCFDCMHDMKSDYSEESHQRLTEFFQVNMNFDHQYDLEAQENMNAEDWTSRCAITGQHISECSQYQIYAYCVGNLCAFENAPFMISGEAMDQLIPLISNKTLGAMNDFRDRYFPPPQDLSPLLKDRDFVLI